MIADTLAGLLEHWRFVYESSATTRTAVGATHALAFATVLVGHARRRRRAPRPTGLLALAVALATAVALASTGAAFAPPAWLSLAEIALLCFMLSHLLPAARARSLSGAMPLAARRAVALCVATAAACLAVVRA